MGPIETPGLEQTAAEARRLLADLGGRASSVPEMFALGAILGRYVDSCVGAEEGRPGGNPYGTRRRAILEVLGAVREMGGVPPKLQVLPSGGAAGADLARAAASFYPAAWLRRSNEVAPAKVMRGRLPEMLLALATGTVAVALFAIALVLLAVWPLLSSVAVGVNGLLVAALGAPATAAAALLLVVGENAAREALKMLGSLLSVSGLYLPLFGGLFMLSRGRANDALWHGMLLHELFHRFEHVVVGLKSVEKAFHEDRERRVVEWFHSYCGYDGNPSGLLEVLSVAYQAMTHGRQVPQSDDVLDPELQPDREHRDFVLGVLAGL